MASKTVPTETGQSDFFTLGNRFFCSFLGSLFGNFLTKFWTTFGCLFGCLLGAFSGLLKFSWEPLDPKTLKNLRFFKVFDNAAFWLFEAPDGSLGLILPPLWPIWSQNGPQNCSQKCSKKEPKIVQVFFFSLFGNPS